MTRTERNLHMGSPTKDAPTGTLTYSEAYALAQKGAKITHRYMAANEWMTVLPNGRICFEDGEDWRNYAEEIEASNTFPDSDATRLEIRIGVGRGDIGIDENQVWVRYHFDLT